MRDKAQGRDFTADDWKALYFVYTLFQQVALHGKPALDTFLAAMRTPGGSDGTE